MLRLASSLVLVVLGACAALWAGSPAAAIGRSAESLEEPAAIAQSSAIPASASSADLCGDAIALLERAILNLRRAIRRDIDDNLVIDNCALWCLNYQTSIDLVELLERLCGETVGVEARRDLFEISLLLSECGC